MAKSKEELKAINAANYQKNREARLAYAKEYYKANKEHRDIKGRQWARENADKTREYNRKSYRKNPNKAIIKARQRKIKMMGNGYEPYTLEQILEEYGQVCYLCELEIDLTLPRKIGVAGWEFGLHLDHVTPISKGGQDCLENVAPTHAICNLNKRGN